MHQQQHYTPFEMKKVKSQWSNILSEHIGKHC